jgi:hypothetical protein
MTTGESVSTAGHGPSRGFSSMGPALNKYLSEHPGHSSESKSRSRSMGPRSSDFRKKPDDNDRIFHFDFKRMRHETDELYQFLKWVHGDAPECPWALVPK